MPKIFQQIVLVFLCAMMSISCGKETNASASARQGVLLIGNSADPATLDPSFTTGLVESKILAALFEGLVALDTKTLKPIPAVAESWAISADGKTYTFKIRKDAIWSDGAKLTAEDFAYSFRRTLNPSLGAEYASMLFVIKNAESFYSGKNSDSSSLGIKAQGDELVMELSAPLGEDYFLSMLAHSVFSPLPKHLLENFNASKTRNAEWTKPKNMVSNGPFVLKKWSVNDCVFVEKNQLYWDRENVFLNGIKFLPISNINTEEKAFRSGMLHATNSVAPSRIDFIRKNAPETLSISDWLGTYYYIFNTKDPALQDVKVRKALTISIDREALIENFLRGKQTAAYNFVPDHCGGFKTKKYFSYNVEEAKKLMKEAGFEGGKNFPKIRLAYNTSEQHKPIAEAIQQMWKQSLNVDAELYNLSWPAYLDMRKRRDFQIIRAGWTADFNAPETFLNVFLSQSGLNHSGFSSKAYDTFLAQAMCAKDNTERFKNLSLAEDELFKEYPILPIYFYTRIFQISPLLEGYNTNLLDYQNFKRLRFRAAKDGVKP